MGRNSFAFLAQKHTDISPPHHGECAGVRDNTGTFRPEGGFQTEAGSAGWRCLRLHKAKVGQPRFYGFEFDSPRVRLFFKLNRVALVGQIRFPGIEHSLATTLGRPANSAQERLRSHAAMR